jgi:hypothetical protein
MATIAELETLLAEVEATLHKNVLGGAMTSYERGGTTVSQMSAAELYDLQFKLETKIAKEKAKAAGNYIRVKT